MVERFGEFNEPAGHEPPDPPDDQPPADR